MTHNVEQNEQQTEREKLYPMLSASFQAAIISVPDEYLSMSEIELHPIVQPKNIDYMLRYNLWKKFHAAGPLGLTSISNIEIFTGVCTSSNWYNRVMQEPAKIAWLLLPVQNSTDVMKEALDFGILKIRNEILTQAVTEKNASTILKAIEFLATRVWGAAVQRIESKNLNLNVGGNGGTEAPATRDAIEAKLLELQQTVQGQNDRKLLEANKSIEET